MLNVSYALHIVASQASLKLFALLLLESRSYALKQFCWLRLT